MKLSLKERLILSNQYLILEKLYPDEATHYANLRKALQQGYALHYKWLAEHFYEEMSEFECNEVLNILNMYRSLNFSYNKLRDKEGLSPDDIKFPGFDGNDENKQFGYTSYFIEDLGRFQELSDREYPDFNSHYPMLERYRRMLAVWDDEPNQSELSAKSIRRIIEA